MVFTPASLLIKISEASDLQCFHRKKREGIMIGFVERREGKLIILCMYSQCIIFSSELCPLLLCSLFYFHRFLSEFYS